MASTDVFVVRLERIKLLQCEKCPRIFNNKDHLARHMNWHEFEEELARPGVMEHMESAQVLLNRVAIYRCTKCSRGFLNYFKLNDHQLQHSQNENSNGAPAESKNNLLKPHKCEECGERFVALSTLTTHLKVHDPFPHVCDCGVGFYLKKDLERHSRLVHPMGKTWKPVIRYNGPKIKSEFAKPAVPSESEDDKSDADDTYVPKITNGAKPRLKAQLVFRKPKTKVKKEKKVNGKENLYINGEGKYECTYCGEEFKKILPYRFHLNTHTGALPHACDRCPRAFAYMAYLLAHQQTHTPGSSHSKCDVCHKTTQNISNLQKHMLTHTGERPFSCSKCRKTFTQAAGLNEHMKRHGDVYDFACSYCKKPFRTRHATTLHERTHTGERPYECPYCGKSFADASAFLRHKRIHTGEKPYQCAICEKAFSDYSAYTVHVKRHAGARYPCPRCPHVSKDRAGLSNHIKCIHEHVPKYECDYCARLFVLKQYLVSHIQSHFNRKRFQCDVCHKYSTSKRNLIMHLKLHAIKSRDHVCEDCNASFKTRWSLLTHIKRVHETRELTYECDYCRGKFAFKDEVFKHIRRFHNRFTCPKCGTIVTTAAQQRHHPCVKCKCCNKYFKNENRMKQHLKPRKKIRKYRCRECLKWFKTPEFLKAHVRRRHWRTCDKCGKSFQQKRVLSHHIWTQHMVTLYCSVCMKPFYRESDLRHHKRTKHLDVDEKIESYDQETGVET